LVPFEENGSAVRGQTASRQLKGLADLAAALELDVDMRNGYAFVAREELARVGQRLDRLSGPERDELAGLLRLGVQSDTEVTQSDAGHRVTQVFCSASAIEAGAVAGGSPATILGPSPCADAFASASSKVPASEAAVVP
jgi:hypothetical protein